MVDWRYFTMMKYIDSNNRLIYVNATFSEIKVFLSIVYEDSVMKLRDLVLER